MCQPFEEWACCSELSKIRPFALPIDVRVVIRAVSNDSKALAEIVSVLILGRDLDRARFIGVPVQAVLLSRR